MTGYLLRHRHPTDAPTFEATGVTQVWTRHGWLGGTPQGNLEATYPDITIREDTRIEDLAASLGWLDAATNRIECHVGEVLCLAKLIYPADRDVKITSHNASVMFGPGGEEVVEGGVPLAPHTLLPGVTNEWRIVGADPHQYVGGHIPYGFAAAGGETHRAHHADDEAGGMGSTADLPFPDAYWNRTTGEDYRASPWGGRIAPGLTRTDARGRETKEAFFLPPRSEVGFFYLGRSSASMAGLPVTERIASADVRAARSAASGVIRAENWREGDPLWIVPHLPLQRGGAVRLTGPDAGSFEDFARAPSPGDGRNGTLDFERGLTPEAYDAAIPSVGAATKRWLEGGAPLPWPGYYVPRDLYDEWPTVVHGRRSIIRGGEWRCSEGPGAYRDAEPLPGFVHLLIGPSGPAEAKHEADARGTLYEQPLAAPSGAEVAAADRAKRWLMDYVQLDCMGPAAPAKNSRGQFMISRWRGKGEPDYNPYTPSDEGGSWEDAGTGEVHAWERGKSPRMRDRLGRYAFHAHLADEALAGERFQGLLVTRYHSLSFVLHLSHNVALVTPAALFGEANGSFRWDRNANGEPYTTFTVGTRFEGPVAYGIKPIPRFGGVRDSLFELGAGHPPYVPGVDLGTGQFSSEADYREAAARVFANSITNALGGAVDGGKESAVAHWPSIGVGKGADPWIAEAMVAHNAITGHSWWQNNSQLHPVGVFLAYHCDTGLEVGAYGLSAHYGTPVGQPGVRILGCQTGLRIHAHGSEFGLLFDNLIFRGCEVEIDKKRSNLPARGARWYVNTDWDPQSTSRPRIVWHDPPVVERGEDNLFPGPAVDFFVRDAVGREAGLLALTRSAFDLSAGWHNERDAWGRPLEFGIPRRDRLNDSKPTYQMVGRIYIQNSPTDAVLLEGNPSAPDFATPIPAFWDEARHARGLDPAPLRLTGLWTLPHVYNQATQYQLGKDSRGREITRWNAQLGEAGSPVRIRATVSPRIYLGRTNYGENSECDRIRVEATLRGRPGTVATADLRKHPRSEAWEGILQTTGSRQKPYIPASGETLVLTATPTRADGSRGMTETRERDYVDPRSLAGYSHARYHP